MHSDKIELNLITNRTGRSLFLPGPFILVFLADEQAGSSLWTNCNEQHTYLQGYRECWGTTLFCHEYFRMEQFHADQLLIPVSLDHMFYLPKHFQSTKDIARATCSGCARPTPPTQSSGPGADTSCSRSLRKGVLWTVLAIVNDLGQQSPVPSLIQEHFPLHHKYWHVSTAATR